MVQIRREDEEATHSRSRPGLQEEVGEEAQPLHWSKAARLGLAIALGFAAPL